MSTPSVDTIAYEVAEGFADYADTFDGFTTEDALRIARAAIAADRAQCIEPVDPDWQNDADDMRDADHVEIRWTARDARGRITFNSDASISGAQAAAMFEAIGRTA